MVIPGCVGSNRMLASRPDWWASTWQPCVALRAVGDAPKNLGVIKSG